MIASQPNVPVDSLAETRVILSTHAKPHATRAIVQVVTVLALLFAAFFLMYICSEFSIFITLALSIPTAGLLVRTFALMHDCAHGSFLPWRRINSALGVMTGLLTWTPFAYWRSEHTLHHSASGDLDRRGVGSIHTITVREYLARSKVARLRYRIYRHPAFLLGLGPLYILFGQRLTPKKGAMADRRIGSIWATNAAIVCLLTAAWIFLGPKTIFLVYLPALYLAASLGIGLFYIQHQFEEAYWEPHATWDFTAAALEGSSHFKLPRILRWCTGNIGLHHVHHWAPRIPNYRLQTCHDENPIFHRAPVVTLSRSFGLFRLALWDEERRRLIRFNEIRSPARS